MTSILKLFTLTSLAPGEAYVWNHPMTQLSRRQQQRSHLFLSNDNLQLVSLIDMDVVIYSVKDDTEESKFLGALQEDGSLSPLSVWTTEPAFGDSMIEFLVDEEDRFSLDENTLKLHYLVDQSELSYGSRQCARGVHNPHGEESELLYYVDQGVIDKFDVKVIVKPELEILW